MKDTNLRIEELKEIVRKRRALIDAILNLESKSKLSDAAKELLSECRAAENTCVKLLQDEYNVPSEEI